MIAARLTEALPDLEIVMIEEGPETMGREDMQGTCYASCSPPPTDSHSTSFRLLPRNPNRDLVPALSMGQVFQGTDTGESLTS